MSALWRNRWGRRSTVALSVIGVAVAAAVAERPSAAHGASSPFRYLERQARFGNDPGCGKVGGVLSDAFATIAARVKPSVVYIIATQNGEPVVHRGGRQRPRRAPGLDQIPPEFRQFFQMPGGGGGGGPEEAPPQGRSVASGSGFSSSRPTGTSSPTSHVVDGASEVHVRLLDRRSTRPRSLAAKSEHRRRRDQIDATDLTPAPLGDSEASARRRVGARGRNPLGENLTFTVTQGVVSAKVTCWACRASLSRPFKISFRPTRRSTRKPTDR